MSTSPWARTKDTDVRGTQLFQLDVKTEDEED